MARRLKADVLNAYSAGVEPEGLGPRAVKVIAEAGIDISGHRSKHAREVMNIPHYRRVRDEIRAFVEKMPQVLREHEEE